MAVHVVQQGECISSIASARGMRWQDVWQHPDNASLRELRKNPNVVAIGDEVTVPEPTIKSVEAAAGQRHRFQVKIPQVRLRLHLAWNGKALANEPYRLEVDGRRLVGTTDGDGAIDEVVPARAKSASLKLTRKKQKMLLRLGGLAPADTIDGACERLRNLGLYRGPSCLEMTAALRASLRRLQKLESLTASGELDDDSSKALEKRHGC